MLEETRILLALVELIGLATIGSHIYVLVLVELLEKRSTTGRDAEVEERAQTRYDAFTNPCLTLYGDNELVGVFTYCALVDTYDEKM